MQVDLSGSKTAGMYIILLLKAKQLRDLIDSMKNVTFRNDDFDSQPFFWIICNPAELT